ncbi:MAG: urea ABC transporter permease subunit UrtC [SAR324 cluster bacterium]|nr:urea ABC transporter permease subunit UrtC [SAR324 cluster bacterium]
MKRFSELHSKTGWAFFAACLLSLLVLVPVLNLAVPVDSALHVPDYLIPLIGKYLCFAIVALAMDLIWGYTGILSLGHGVFFALGGYAMGMHLMRAMSGEGVYRSELPDFMVFLDWKELPWYWYGFDNFYFSMLMVLLIPGLLAYIFGYFAFHSRIKGVYLSIITQAMTYASMLAFFRNDMGFGGNNGLTDFKHILGFSLQDQGTKVGLFMLTGFMLGSVYLLSRFIVTSRLGRILMAIRDAEQRVRFSGYDSTNYKLFVWTLSAVLCAIAGALYVPQVGIINPGEMQPSNSIEMAIWVAVGGRGTLLGALVGSGIVNSAKSLFTAMFPDLWLYFLGVLFIAVTLYFPQGIVGLLQRISQGVKHGKHH